MVNKDVYNHVMPMLIISQQHDESEHQTTSRKPC